MTKKLLFVTTLLLVVAFVAAAADVSGKWVYEQQGRNGNATKVTLTLKADGGKLTGNISRPGRDGNAMETAISDGKVDGNNVSFKTSQQMGDNTFTTEYTGTLSGDDLKLTINRPGRDGNMMKTEVTAKRATT